MLYRFGKFVRRHKAGASAAMIVAVALMVGITGTTIGMIRATRAEAEASTVSEFLVGLFKVSDPSETRGKTITAKEILDRGALQIRQELADQPQILARLMGVLAILVKKELLLVIIGGLFVAEVCSVILQVSYFKRRRKRLFRMAPVHHHFELKGWAESKVVVRFWIVGILLALLSLSTFKIR